MSNSISKFVTLVPLGQCWKCGIEFAAPDTYVKKRREHRDTFYCPNGHPACFGVSEADKLREKLVEADAALAREMKRTETAKQQLESAVARERAQKGVVTKLKKRMTRGPVRA